MIPDDAIINKSLSELMGFASKDFKEGVFSSESLNTEPSSSNSTNDLQVLDLESEVCNLNFMFCSTYFNQ